MMSTFTAIITVCLSGPLPCDPGRAAAMITLEIDAESKADCERILHEAIIIADPALTTVACFIPQDRP